MERLQKWLTPDDFYRLKRELEDYDINWDMVIDYISTTININSLSSPSPYIRQCIVNEVRFKGAFVKSKTYNSVSQEQVAFFSHWKRVEALGIKINKESKFMVENLIKYIHFNYNVSLNEIEETTDRIIDYLKDKNLSTDDYLELLKNKSKIIVKYNVNLDKWKLEAQEEYEMWEDLYNSLNSLPDIKIEIDDPFYKIFEEK